MRQLSRIFLFGMVLLIGSCNSSSLKTYSQLGDLRILAVVVKDTNGSTSEGSPGDTFTVNPYISDIVSTGAITFSIVGCVDPGVSYGASPTCAGSSSLTTYTLSSVTAPYTDFAGTFTVTIPSAILSGQSTATQYNGYNYILLITATNTNGTSVTSLKRITVSTKSTKNNNPSISSITSSGATLGALSTGSVVSLAYVAGAGSAESYQYENSDGSFTSYTETLQATWFATDGSLQYTRTNDGGTTQFTAPSSYPTSRSSVIVTVLRDGRGGEAVVKNTIHLN
jgi:hypothetical protein